MTAFDAALETAQHLLQPFAGTETRPEPQRLDVELPVEQLLAAAGALRAADWGYLDAITGLDDGPQAGTLEVLYSFCAGAAIVTLRVRLPRGAPTVPSLTPLTPAAGPFERELSEMLGVAVTGNPNMARLYLPEDWPDDVYPIRKDAALAPPDPGDETLT